MTSNANVIDTASESERQQDNKEDSIFQSETKKSLLSTKHGWWSSTMANRIPWMRNDHLNITNFNWWKRRLDGEIVPVTITKSDGSTDCPYGSRVTAIIYLGELTDHQRYGDRSQIYDAEAVIERLYGTTKMAPIPSGTNPTSEEAPMAATSEKAAVTPIEPKDLHSDN